MKLTAALNLQTVSSNGDRCAKRFQHRRRRDQTIALFECQLAGGGKHGYAWKARRHGREQWKLVDHLVDPLDAGDGERSELPRSTNKNRADRLTADHCPLAV